MDFRSSVISKLASGEIDNFKSNYFTLASKLWKYTKSKVLRRYGYSIDIKDDYRINVINDMIKSFDKNFNKRNISDNGLLCDTSVIYTIDENTFMYVIAGDPLSDDSMKILLDSQSDSKSGNRLKLYIYGKHAKKYFNKIKNAISKRSSSNGSLHIFNISSNSDDKDRDSFQSIISDMKPRDIDTLYYEPGIKESVVAHIDGFFNTKKLYEEKNINYKTSLLLYGPPGTGKSSLVNALCNKYSIDMILVDMNTFDKLDVNILTQCINGDDNTYLVLLEDIDTIFNMNRDSENVDKDDKKIINKLLQFLDSNSSPNNVIFCYTTNHIDRLDEALLRKGRVDKQVYIGPINRDVAYTMCKSFDISEEGINTILNKYKNSPDGLINQSALQGDILETIKEETMSKLTLNDMINQVAADEAKVINYRDEKAEEPEEEPVEESVEEKEVDESTETTHLPTKYTTLNYRDDVVTKDEIKDLFGDLITQITEVIHKKRDQEDEDSDENEEEEDNE